MASLFESPYLSNRLRQIEERYEEPTTFGKCDCTSYSYLALSIVLCTIGTAITVLALGDVVDGHIFSHLGHMWLVGPIFICSGIMVAVKCILYLRRKSVIQMIIHQRQLFRHLQGFGSGQALSSSGSMTPGPPAYEAIAQSQGPLIHQTELPPPTYAEAVALLQQQDAKPCSTADNMTTTVDAPRPACKP
ncbi:uncharacterized protein LOC131664449 isoform X2 [Phymastichus coffea]|uniref:uncharacterized protein LOC131664449 isoform X2 n=1 Tax=Phymastichus coffea TaxID=108790 RepID=UPI00273BD6A0|nr:uncharacterized protein LOC131664449 isoform X2 [Phymastichus coffea]